MSDTETILTQTTYMMYAVLARDYVKSKMDIGPSDKVPNSMWGWPARQLCTSELTEHAVDDLKKQKPEIRRTGKNPNRAILDTWADWARFYGCGNCGVQSALAFAHIRDSYHVFPLDWMVITKDDHGFVVLGRIGVTDPGRMSTWNSEAVVCDPWKGKALAASDADYLSGFSPTLLYRMSDATAF